LSDADINEMMACSTTATTAKGVSSEHLSKIWRITRPEAARTIEVNTQLRPRQPKESLTRNYSTNDRMLRYRRVNDHFFMDTFFATKKAKKSTRGTTCMQLFVTDKGYVYVIPMRSKSEVPQALKAFAKAVGAPDAYDNL
jgi:hypothetical protein